MMLNLNFWRRTVVIYSLILALPLPAAVRHAASANLGDVSAALDASSSGDTVVVPPGSAVWTKTLNIGKEVTLLGSGPAATFITNSVEGHQPLFAVAFNLDTKFRISGFYFDCNWDKGGGAVAAYTRGYQDSWKAFRYIQGFRIDHCVFDRAWYNNGSGAAPLDMWGRVWGVVDHCEFIDGVYAARLYGNPISLAQARSYGWPADCSGTEDWTKMPAPYYYLGSTNNFVMEDCTLRTRNPIYSPPPTTSRLAVSSAWSTHYVFRYNVVTNSFIDGFNDVLDLHGNKAIDGTYRGAVCFECYGNRIYTTNNAYRLAYLRGGTCMVFSNQILGYARGSGSIVLEEEETWNGVGPINTNWPANDQITNSYFWANTANGFAYGPIVSSELDRVAPGFFKEGRDYWLRSPGPSDALSNYVPLAYPHPLIAAWDSASSSEERAKMSIVIYSGSAVITPPFVVNTNQSIYQSITTFDPSAGGRAVWQFFVPKSDTYNISAAVLATTAGANSFFIEVDSDPDSSMVWEVPVSSGWQEQTVSLWGQTGALRTWFLTAGQHRLFVRGRSSGAQIGNLQVRPSKPTPPRDLAVSPK